MRDEINQALKTAMKAGDKRRVGTLRLINATIKDRDLGIGGAVPTGDRISDQEILGLLQKMIKQRRESIETYSQAGRQDLVDQEAAEIAVIEEFMPKQMGEDEVRAAVAKVIGEIGAAGLKDMGRTMAEIKTRYAGQMDFSKASAIVKDLLK